MLQVPEFYGLNPKKAQTLTKMRDTLVIRRYVSDAPLVVVDPIEKLRTHLTKNERYMTKKDINKDFTSLVLR
jgi:hypothetical protein